jgi:hypothetical protein
MPPYLAKMPNNEETRLSPGVYPFADQTYALEAMAFAEVPPELEVFLKQATGAAGIGIIRDRPVELVCRSGSRRPEIHGVVATGHERLHVLTPKSLMRGRA